MTPTNSEQLVTEPIREEISALKAARIPAFDSTCSPDSASPVVIQDAESRVMDSVAAKLVGNELKDSHRYAVEQVLDGRMLTPRRSFSKRLAATAGAVGGSLVTHAIMALAAATIVLSLNRTDQTDRRDLELSLSGFEPQHDLSSNDQSQTQAENASADPVSTDPLQDVQEIFDRLSELTATERLPDETAIPEQSISSVESIQENPSTTSSEDAPAPWAKQAIKPMGTWLGRADGGQNEHVTNPNTHHQQDDEHQAHENPGIVFAGAAAAEGVQSVVYVIDASGPMVTALPIVLEEVKRSVANLAIGQRFGVVLFREPLPGSESARIEVFRSELIQPTSDHRAQLAHWLAGIAPSGASNPLAGLEAALLMKPDLIFLLSRSFERSAGGVWGRGQKETLARLEKLNPPITVEGQPERGRAVQIQTIAFLEDDPTGTLQAIAALHGPRSTLNAMSASKTAQPATDNPESSPSTPPGYRVIRSRDELLTRPAPSPVSKR